MKGKQLGNVFADKVTVFHKKVIGHWEQNTLLRGVWNFMSLANAKSRLVSRCFC